MPVDGPVRVVIGSDAAPGWRWIADDYAGPPAIDWRFASAHDGDRLSRLPGPHWGRIRAAMQVRRLVRRRAVDLVVTMGPYPALYTAALRPAGVPQLAMMFNFTAVPDGAKRRLMRRAYARVDRFLVFSRLERQLYADQFGLAVDRFHFIHWGVNPPIAEPGPRTVAGRYVAAIGGEGRDYATLCAAARRLPDVRFVLVVRPHSLAGVDVPPNVEVHVNLPLEQTWTIAWHADALLVPLRSSATPNGHVTIVGGMHLGKPQVATDSAGIRDYLADGETALLVPPGDDAAFAAAIRRLIDHPEIGERQGVAARAFAARYCTEQALVDGFRRHVAEMAAQGT